MQHLVVAPILIPLVAALVMLLAGEARRRFNAALGVTATLAQFAAALILMIAAAGASDTVFSHVYRLGDWPATFGIVLVLDRLAAMMLALTSALGLAALVYALARWHRAGAQFHPLFQFQLMGLNGAFLTGDLFNLFVFFEVMLAASYAMALHGQDTARIRASLHYIAINLVASLLFLVGASILYGVVGTLNMADLSARMANVARADRGLVEAGAAILGVAFLIKAGMWPLGFWLPRTYSAASAPAAAILSILSKVGVYALLRLWLLLFGADGFGGAVLFWGGLATIAYGSLAALATQSLPRFASASVLVSSGTLLAALGAGDAEVTRGALFYLVSSVLGLGGFFLLIELVERGRQAGADLLSVTREAYAEPEAESPEEEEVGVAIPAPTALLGVSFVCCGLLIAGLPPLSGFLAKFSILAPVWSGAGGVGAAWPLLVALLGSSVVALIALTRSGVAVFWADGAPLPPVRVVEIAPILFLLALTVALTVLAGPATRYLDATAKALHTPQTYVRSVLPGEGARP
ncbi:MAG TPA: monovalent cation/H+ antiporter subunit D [Beijerinckiaceae bacterium]